MRLGQAVFLMALYIGVLLLVVSILPFHVEHPRPIMVSNEKQG